MRAWNGYEKINQEKSPLDSDASFLKNCYVYFKNLIKSPFFFLPIT